MTFRRSFLFVYLLALLFMGLGYLAILPVFEGFDENAHYSSLRQIADTGTIPLYDKSYLNQETIDYQGPVAYSSGMPPFDRNMVYSKFFTNPKLVEYYRQTYRQPLPHSLYRISQVPNWQAQHPPLYYLLLAPLVNALDHVSLVTQFFLLRMVSFLLALAGVAFGLLAFRQPNLPPEADPAVIGFVLYPVILPMFFPEFTRIGNDSLCLFLVGLVAYLLSLWLKDERNTKISIAIGIALGMGLLTKAFFLPITAGLVMFLLIRLWLDKQNVAMRSQRGWNLLQIILPALLIGGGWYVYKLVVYGVLSGSDSAIQLARQGGLIAGLKENFSLYGLVRGVVGPLVSYSWAGTWSLTRIPILLHLPLLLLAAWVIGAFLLQLKRRSLTDPVWLPVWVFGFFGCGLFWNVVINVALSAHGNTPGWYLHILMPWIAPALGIGAISILQHRRSRLFLIGFLFYAVLFQMIALWAQLALFTGCATKGDDKYYAFSGHAFCLDQTSLLMDRVAVLGYPSLAAIGFGGGLICTLWLLMLVLKNRYYIHGGEFGEHNT